MYDIEKRVSDIAVYIADKKCTVRQAAAYFGISKSTVHKDMSERLERIDRRLFDQVEQVLQYNKEVRHIRGGEATKNKYMMEKLAK